MNAFLETSDKMPFVCKLLLCLPVLDLFWAVYRIVKGAATHNGFQLFFGIVWIVPGCFACWLIDFVSVLVARRPRVFA